MWLAVFKNMQISTIGGDRNKIAAGRCEKGVCFEYRWKLKLCHRHCINPVLGITDYRMFERISESDPLPSPCSIMLHFVDRHKSHNRFLARINADNDKFITDHPLTCLWLPWPA